MCAGEVLQLGAAEAHLMSGFQCRVDPQDYKKVQMSKGGPA